MCVCSSLSSISKMKRPDQLITSNYGCQHQYSFPLSTSAVDSHRLCETEKTGSFLSSRAAALLKHCHAGFQHSSKYQRLAPPNAIWQFRDQKGGWTLHPEWAHTHEHTQASTDIKRFIICVKPAWQPRKQPVGSVLVIIRPITWWMEWWREGDINHERV